MNVMNPISEAKDFDPFDLNAPHAVWELFRKQQPIFYHEKSGYWVVSRYNDIKAIFNDWKTFSSENAQKPMPQRIVVGDRWRSNSRSRQ